MSKFPIDIANFGAVFVAMQLKRHRADYDPFAKFYKSEVINDRAAGDAVRKAFEASHVKDLRAFASWVIVKKRR